MLLSVTKRKGMYFSGAGNFCILLPIHEGPEGVKWELGFAHFLAGKMGFHALGLRFINKKIIENGNGIKI